MNVKAEYAKVRIDSVWKKWVEIEKVGYTEKGQEKDCRFRISKKDMNKIDNSRKKEIGGKEIEREKRKRGQEMSVKNVNREKERNFGLAKKRDIVRRKGIWME